jgi:integrase
MAWLELKAGAFRIGFRYGGKKHHFQLKTDDRKAADAALGRFLSNFHLIEQGVIAPPPAGAELGTYIVSGGKLGGRPSRADRVEPKTLADLFESYLAHYPKGAKEATTLKTERIHVGHLRRLLDTELPLADVTAGTMQRYVEARTAHVGAETIRKEVGTFAAVWNKWAVPQGMVRSPAPVTGLVYPKADAKPPFQTREQIERQLANRRTSPEEEAALWDCLFLTVPEIDEVLEVVRRRERVPQAYPMFVFAAHTGARRSEIRRSLVSDFDFGTRTVLIREKKREHDKRETYRTVPMSGKLEEVMRAWFAAHPGGHHAVCTAAGNPITEHYATKLVVNALKRSRWSVVPGWHCFRHSFISNCAARGVDQRMIDAWVGHQTEAMRRRYRHLIPAVSQAALASVFG